ncbi:MAG: hypothetical protein ACSHX8_11605 [Opitutaceae bacterium]
MGTSYTKTKRMGGKPTIPQRLFKPALLLGTLVLFCAVIYTLITFSRSEETVTTITKLPHGTLNELTDIEAFTQAYLSVNCNRALLANTQTIRVTGNFIVGDNNLPFSLVKKRPDRMLFTIDHGSHEITIGVSEDAVWKRLRASRREDLFTLIESVEADTWRERSNFFDHIIRASQGEGTITSIEATNWEGNDCLKVSLQNTEGDSIDIFVSPLTLYPIVEIKLLDDGTIKQTRFSDYRDVDGMPLPFRMESSQDGEVVSQIVLRSAALNTGVLSKVFDMPEALTVKE